MLGMPPILPAECVAAAKRREEGGELSLEAAETLFWLRGVPAAGDSDDSDSDDEGDRDMNGLKTPRLMMTPPEASRLARCPNCGFYGIVGAGEATEAFECAKCCWKAPPQRVQLFAPNARPTAGFLPAMSASPRASAVEQRLEAQHFEQRTVDELRALHLASYVKPRRQERPAGGASRVPHVARTASPEPVWHRPVPTLLTANSPRARAPSTHAAAAPSVTASSAFGGIAAAAIRSADLMPLPWLAGRATPPPLPPYVPPPPPVEVSEVEDEAAIAAKAAAAVRPPSPWTLEKSIWAPRKKWSDGKSLTDDDRILRRAMECDFKRALEDGLDKHITRDYDGGEPPTEEEMAAELEEVKEALVAVARPIYSLFDFYASLGSGGSVTTISFNGYKQFLADTALAIDRSKHCDDSHLDQLFIQINSSGALLAAAVARATGIKVSGARAFGRSEMVHMLVRVAINRQILDGDEEDVSTAVMKLCEHLEQRLVSAAKQSADDFRVQYCYVEKVSLMLAKHKRSLRAVFDVYADYSNLKDPKDKLLCFNDWMLLLKHLLFFDEAFQQREGAMCFVFSRLRVIDEESKRGKTRIHHLTFEDFCEAVVRLATMKALPTTAELLLLGANDCGTFLTELRANPQGYNAFVEARERAWGDKLRQPIERCVEHLINLLIRTVESATTGFADCKLSKATLMRFRQQAGARIGVVGSNGPSPKAGAKGAAQAQATTDKAAASKAVAASPFGLFGAGKKKDTESSSPGIGGAGGSIAGMLASKMGDRTMKWGAKAKSSAADAAEAGAEANQSTTSASGTGLSPKLPSPGWRSKDLTEGRISPTNASKGGIDLRLLNSLNEGATDADDSLAQGASRPPRKTSRSPTGRGSPSATSTSRGQSPEAPKISLQ